MTKINQNMSQTKCQLVKITKNEGRIERKMRWLNCIISDDVSTN